VQKQKKNNTKQKTEEEKVPKLLLLGKIKRPKPNNRSTPAIDSRFHTRTKGRGVGRRAMTT
jgi:hypothetical protein